MHKNNLIIHKFVGYLQIYQKMIITLTTDFGLKDHYVGALKGLLYRAIPNVNLVDISHQITPFAIQETCYVIESAYSYFPEKTIHIILVDQEVSQNKKPLIVLWNNHYFLSADNGILSMLTSEKKPDLMVNVIFNQNEGSTHLFVRIASDIAKGKHILELGEPTEHLKEQNKLKPIVSIDNNRITGSIIHIDSYGNAISNISNQLFDKIGKGRRFEILFRNYSITKIHKNYIDYEPEKKYGTGKLSIFNSSGLLEIAIYRASKESGGTASSLLGLSHQSSIVVQFFDN